MTDEQHVQVEIIPSPDGLGREAAIVIPRWDGDDGTDLRDLVGLGGSAVEGALARNEVRSSPYETTLFFPPGDGPALAFVGAGKREEIDALRLMRVFSAASMYLTARSFSTLVLVDRDIASSRDFGQAAISGAIRGAYNPGLKKTRGQEGKSLSAISLLSTRDDEELRSGMALGQIVGECSTIARDLVNLPANELTPSAFAAKAEELAGAEGLQCEILDEKRMAELGMGSFLGVAAGSSEPPRLISLRYGDPSAPIKLAVVGKGITFDSGGLSLKTAEGMETMKGDMGGGAAVVAGMAAVARLAPQNIAVMGYVGATENMPSGSAMRPGDVLTAMTGETIEVLNTDAEGRLVLADVLAYAASQGATHVVDFATLTGGAVVALGTAASLAAGRPMEWVQRVAAAAAAGLERVWPMPLYEEYRRAMDSEVADIKNTGGRYGSALTASAFLSDFVGDTPWTHVDIAGTAFADKGSAYSPAGGTGEGVSTIASLALELSGQQ